MMKIEVTPSIAEDLIAQGKVVAKVSDPWWIIALKVLAYLIGLLLAGTATPAAAQEVVNVMGGII